MLKIAVDAMGGDYAPANEVEGAIEAARDFGVGVILVGRSEEIQPELDRHRRGRALGSSRHWRSSSIEIVDAREVVTMDDPVATAVRRKRNSSIRVAAQLVREGKAQALVSAGNTGAVMMTSKLVIGTLPRVDRPALAAVLPTLTGRGSVILDVGANAECKASHLYDFAVMGSFYSSVIVGVKNPRVGLLSIGEEEIKGNDLTKEAFKLLKELAHQFHRQRRRARHVYRPGRRDRVRRIYGQHSAQDERRRRRGLDAAAQTGAKGFATGKGGRVAYATGFSEIQTADRLRGIRRRAAARHKRASR